MDGRDGKPLRVAVAGASGRLGKTLLALIDADPGWCLSHAWVSDDNPQMDHACGVGNIRFSAIGKPEISRPQVIVDFSSAEALELLVQTACVWQVPLVSGTTGLTQTHHDKLDQAARQTAVLWAPNFSLTVLLWQGFLARLSRVHGTHWQAHIEETHHAGKKDAPSGTALALAQNLLGQQIEPLQPVSGNPLSFNLGRMNIRSHRVGQVAGEHTVLFQAPGEILHMRHSAEGPELFARGALQVARWLARQPHGRYTMEDYLATVLGQVKTKNCG